MRNNLRGDGDLLCNVAVSRIIFDFLDEQLTMITRLPNHGDIIQVSSSPPLFFSLSLLASPLSPSLSSTSPLVFLLPALSRKSRRKIHEPRHDVSAATFIRIAFCIRPHCGRNNGASRDDYAPSSNTLLATPLHISWRTLLLVPLPAAIKTFHRFFVSDVCRCFLLPFLPPGFFCFSCLLIFLFFCIRPSMRIYLTE